MAKRKFINMHVRVSVPADLSAKDARREVRTLINHQTGYLSRLEEGAVKALSVQAIPKQRVW